MPLALALGKSLLFLTITIFPLGFGSLRLLERRLAFALPGEFRRLNAALFLGTLGNLLLPLLAALFLPPVFPVVSLLQVLVSVGLAVWSLRRLQKLEVSNQYTWALLGFMGIAAAGVLLAAIFPGAVDKDYGDLPSWYRAAQNILTQVKPLDDTWIADYGGTYKVAELFPLPTIAIAWQSAVLGFAPYALEAFGLLFGLSGLGLFAELVQEYGPRDSVSWRLFAAVSPLLLFLGTTNLLVFLFAHPLLMLFSGGLFLVSLLSLPRGRGAFALAAVVSVVLALSHLLAIVFLAALAGAWALQWAAQRTRRPGLSFLIFCVLAVAGGIMLSAVALPARFSIFPYLVHGEQGWQSVFTPWYRYNLFLSLQAIGLPTTEVENARVLAELLRHPLSFVGFFLRTLGENIAAPALAVGCLLSLPFARGRWGVILAAGLFYILADQCMVLSFRERHSLVGYALVVLPALTGIGALGMRRPRWLLAVSALMVLGFAAANAGLYREAREARASTERPFLVAANYLLTHAGEREVIVTNQPKGLAFILSRPMMGGHFLGMDQLFTNGFLAKFHPGMVALFGEAAVTTQQTPGMMPGYHPVLENPALMLLILKAN